MLLARLFPISVVLAFLALVTASAAAQAPATQVGSTSAVQTATLTFAEDATVASINVLTQGAANMDFQFSSGGSCAVGRPYTTGQTCTVNYTFKPTRPGPRYGAAVLYDNSSPANPAATTYLQGAGNGPQVAYNPPKDVLLAPGTSPWGLAVDGSGNVFFVEGDNTPVKEIVAAGGYGDVITLGSSLFYAPRAVAVDGAGNVLVADPGNDAIKEIVAAGGYQTVLTLASFAAAAIAVDGSGNLFLAGGDSVWEITAASGYTTKTELCGASNNPCSPVSIALDGSGNVYIADSHYRSIRKILASGGYSTINVIGPTFRFPYQGGFAPGGVAVDGNDNVFITYNDKSFNEWVAEIFAQGGYKSTTIIAEDREHATALALDGYGNVYFPSASDPGGVMELNFSDPPRLVFATTAAGSTSIAKIATVINSGNRKLNLSTVSYPVDFPEASGVSTDCAPATSLAASTSCTLSIEFFPLRTSATGSTTPLNESVTITDNNLNVTNAEQSVAVSGTEAFTAPALTTPTPGTTIGSTSATFTWNPGSATTFQFRLGTTLGSNNIYGSGQTNATSETVSSLPTGQNIYARLYYMLAGAWKSLDYTYPGMPQAPALTTPAPGSTLSGSTVTFSWNPGSATTFQFRLGTTTGSNNLYGSGQTSKTSVTVSGLPTNGETIHARLYFMVNGAWQYNDYTYTAE